MKGILLFSFFLFFIYTARAQKQPTADEQEALELVKANLFNIGITTNDLEKIAISSTYKDVQTGIRYVYLNHSWMGIPVLNQMLVLSFRNNQLLSSAGKLPKNLQTLVNGQTGRPALSAGAAILRALKSRGVSINVVPPLIAQATNNGKQVFNKGFITKENITAGLSWVPVANDSSLRLCWEVFISPLQKSDYEMVYIDAASGNVVYSINLTVEDTWPSAHKASNREDIPVEQVKTGYAEHQHHLSIPSITGKADGANFLNIAAYRVIPFPAENPLVVGGAPALRINPWQAAPGDATTLKWHRGVNSTDYTYSRGNNVWAYHDRILPNEAQVGKSAQSSTGPDPLTFDFIPNFTVDPTQSSPVQNQQFNITNLFYWNNIIHDVMYQYGFTEPAGNFQADNMGRGGIGNDFIRAEAQDAEVSNNANFSTPPDGTSGRMQMGLYTLTSPERASDVDNGIIVHEYGHGLSNRLTGGPGNSGCLFNAEQMGEGWSDYYALMFTQDWATANLSSGVIPRGIGSYARNNSKAAGIRTYPYCTSLGINPLVYKSSIPSQVHARGEIWCATLWDMTWAIIQQEGWINPNLYDAAGGGGNNIALKLVTEGMKLQPCAPGFIDGRDAIIQADINLYGGVHVCTIKEAFRRRGMGEGASQGWSDNVNDQVPSYAKSGATLSLLQQGITSTREGQNIAYINRISATTLCEPISNFVLRDTLPFNVNFVSADNGGIYDTISRVVSWPVNLLAGEIKDFAFTVNIPIGSYYLPETILDESVQSQQMPATFISSSTTSTQWKVGSVPGSNNPYFLESPASSQTSTQSLSSTQAFTLPSRHPVLSFWHSYETEAGFDGGVVEISTNGGLSWIGVGGQSFLSNGYTSFIAQQNINPALRNRQVFSGSANFKQTLISLKAFAGRSQVKIRFRFASDDSNGGKGWLLDDILLIDAPRVYMKSVLYSTNGEVKMLADTVMNISESSGPAISVSGNLAVFETCAGNASAPQNLYISGSGLTNPVKIAAPAGYEVSTLAATGYAPSLLLTPLAGALNNREIFVRLSAAATANSYGSISCNAAGALEVLVPVSGILSGYSNSSQTITDNHALDFDGVNDYVTIKNPSSVCEEAPWDLSDAITIEYWFKGSNPRSAVRLQSDNNSFIVSGYPRIDSGFMHILSNDGSVFFGLSAGANIVDGNWHHVAMTWQKNTVNGFRSYLDGVLVAQRNSSNTSLPPINASILLGSYLGTGEFMNGSLDELRIWNISRTEAEIQQHRYTLPSSPQTGLLVYFKFDHGIAGASNGTVNAVANSANPLEAEGLLNNFALTGSSSNWVAPAVEIPRYYVKNTGNDANDGKSWAAAFKTLQKALTVSEAGNSIWVAAGTYYADEGPGMVNNDRNAFFALKNGVSIYGGFAGTEQNLSQRNLALNACIISGEIQQDNDINNNSNSIFRNTNVDSTALLDGFSIVQGSAVSAGGALLNSGASPTIANCIFNGNTAPGTGAVMNNSNSSPRFKNCVFSNNGNATVGGAVAFNAGSSPTFMNCNFVGNQAASGSVFFSQASSFPVITNSIAWGNFGAGAVFGTTATSGVTITYSTIQGGYSGEGNSSQNPLFTDAANGNYSLLSCSPAINTGTLYGAAKSDILGIARPAAGAIDMGAYEKQVVYGEVVYVRAAAAGNNKGLNWSNAFVSLQDALQAAVADSCIKQIWTASGVYKPTTGNDRSQSFTMRNSLGIYGGFNGTQYLLNQRKISEDISILSGDIGVLNDKSDNSFHVIFNNNNNLNQTAILDGFTIIGGNANISGANTEDGGGIFNRNASPLIRNCIFRDNQASYGGGMSNYPGAPSVINCKFLGNNALVSGGAVYNSSAASYFNAIFIGNTSSGGQGGAISNEGGAAAVITNCSFSGNSCAVPGVIYNFNSNPIITNCLLWGNDSGIANDGSSIPVVSYSILQGGYPGTGNLDVNPLFLLQPVVGLGTTGNLQLLACSPAINAGTAAGAPAMDINGNARPALGAVDIGAYEQQTEPLPIVYVDSSARGANDGSSWANAFTHLPFALKQLNVCAPTFTMHIAKGTYTGPVGNLYDFDKLNAIILGGYPSGGGTRNAAENPVILKGDIRVFKSLQMDGIKLVPY